MNEIVLADHDTVEAIKLAALVRDLNLKGHNPATSGNYSLRSSVYPGVVLVSESGIDKSLFTEKNFLLVDEQTGELFGEFKNSGRKSSDETGLHLAIYNTTNAGCVLHSHILDSLLFADLYPHEAILKIEGLELLKGFKGTKSHEEQIAIPCFENSQDIAALAQQVKSVLPNVRAYGFILRGHGIYVWGESVKDAKRHLEVFEYIFRYKLATYQQRIS